MPGARWRAVAILVSGPMGDQRQAPRRGGGQGFDQIVDGVAASGLARGAGRSAPSMPVVPWTWPMMRLARQAARRQPG